jgi:L-2,4-diaminobutyric acid acetyltransferase
VDAGAETAAGLVLRAPERADGARMHELVRASESLEENSRYAYLLVATHFAATSLVAERDGTLVGMVAGYRLPARPDTLFVWQIGVAREARRSGLGRRMLRELLRRPACRDVRRLEATVAEGNEASRRLFESLARELGAPCRREAGFAAADFGGQTHEAERLLCIGPWEIEA